jgi:hypothetical protein
VSDSRSFPRETAASPTSVCAAYREASQQTVQTITYSLKRDEPITVFVKHIEQASEREIKQFSRAFMSFLAFHYLSSSTLDGGTVDMLAISSTFSLMLNRTGSSVSAPSRAPFCFRWNLGLRLQMSSSISSAGIGSMIGGGSTELRLDLRVIVWLG